MSEYKAPVCDCGNQLHYAKYELREMKTSIDSDGWEKNIAHNKTVVLEHEDFLFCLKCQASYDVEKDSELRIIRGKRDEDGFIVPNSRII